MFKSIYKILGLRPRHKAGEASPIETNDLRLVIERLNEVIRENDKLLSQSHNLIGQLKQTV